MENNREANCHEIGRMDNSDGSLEIANRVYLDDGCSPCLNAHANDTVPKVMQIVAMRSCDKENPSGYRGPSNGNMEQALEPNSEGISNTITSVQKDNLVLETSNIVIGSMQEHASVRNDGICPTLTEAMGKGGGQTPMVMVKQATKDGYIPCEGGVCDLNYPSSTTRRGRVQENGRVCPTLTTENIPSVLEPWIWEVDGIRYLIRIRKLTPKECWRLMFATSENTHASDDDFDKAQAVNSNTQLYKQAGNSICVSVLENLFRQLIE